MERSQRKQSYSTMSLEAVRKQFQLKLVLQQFFTEIVPVVPSEFLRTTLRRAEDLSLSSEKARSEFIVAPILLELRELVQHSISIYSGVRFDVAPKEGLQGVCDFIVTKSPPLPTVQAPLIVMVEAKKNDLEEGLGQCAAEMVAAQRVNQEEKVDHANVYGCVTTGELWQFLQLSEKTLLIDPGKHYIDQIEMILGILLKMVA